MAFLCTITFADVADQRGTRRISVSRAPLIVSPDDHVPSFNFLDPALVELFSVVRFCRPVRDLSQSGFVYSEVCFHAIRSTHQDSPTLVYPCLRPQAQLCHKVSDLAFLIAAVPALRYQVANPVRFGCFCNTV